MNTAVRWISLICNLIQMEVAITKAAYYSDVEESCKQWLDNLIFVQLRPLHSFSSSLETERFCRSYLM